MVDLADLFTGGFLSLFGWFFAWMGIRIFVGEQASQALIGIFELNYHSLYQVESKVALILFIAIFFLCLTISFIATFKAAGLTANSFLGTKHEQK